MSKPRTRKQPPSTSEATKSQHTPDPGERTISLLLAENINRSVVSTLLAEVGYRCKADNIFLEVATSAAPIMLGIEDDDKTMFLASIFHIDSSAPWEDKLLLLNKLNRESLLPIFFIGQESCVKDPLSMWNDMLPDKLTAHAHIPVASGLFADQLVKTVRTFETEISLSKATIQQSGLLTDSPSLP